MERRTDPNDFKEYTFNEFCQFYGPQEGRNVWDKAQQKSHTYYVGMRVRALTKLAGDRDQVVNQGDVGSVTALPGPGSSVERGAVAEVLIRGVRFDAQPGMIEPCGNNNSNNFRNSSSDRPRNDRNNRNDRNERGNDRGGRMNDRNNNRMNDRNNNRGQSGPRGGEERRTPLGDNQSYTRSEFLDYYGQQKGAGLWNKSAPSGGKGQRNNSRPQKEERRADPSEKSGRTYTKNDFLDLYGPKKGISMWKKAGKEGGAKEEKRADPNEKNSKKTYTRAEFLKCYGDKAGAAIWKKAGKAAGAPEKEERRRDPNEPKSKKTYTKKEFIDLYGAKKGAAICCTAPRRELPSGRRLLQLRRRRSAVTLTSQRARRPTPRRNSLTCTAPRRELPSGRRLLQLRRRRSAVTLTSQRARRPTPRRNSLTSTEPRRELPSGRRPKNLVTRRTRRTERRSNRRRLSTLSTSQVVALVGEESRTPSSQLMPMVLLRRLVSKTMSELLRSTERESAKDQSTRRLRHARTLSQSQLLKLEETQLK
eukprot:TRINITY_DN305_c0_g1_i2.p1 TRINITY_DN305_c0_g1~~TRINITY_DN305_c0_g1_i2.p1  ORF type:complete len:533 (+),score=111.63 TRINITY_DN305_c0_g1_i2:68-1666(+)